MFLRTHAPLLVLLAGVLLVGIATLPAEVYAGDPVNIREETRSLVLGGELAMQPDADEDVGESGQYVVLNPRDGRRYSKYGVGNSLGFLPPMVAERLATGALPKVTSPSRFFFLNAWNLVLLAVCAALLYELARLFAAGRWTPVAYVAICFYTTFAWHFLRAQTTEIFTLVLAFALFRAWLLLVRAWVPGDGPAKHWKRIAVAWLCLAGLVLCRLSFVVWIPVVTVSLAALLWRRGGRSPIQVARALVPATVLPVVALVAVLLALNDLKFGSPWKTGYHAWRPEITGFGGAWSESLPALLWSPHWSLAGHFPPLLLALFAARPFARRFPHKATVAAAALGIMLLVLGRIPSWRGEDCYGPRYFIAALPLASLPLVLLLDRCAELLGTLRGRVAVAAAALVLAYSTFLQVEVIRYPFFTYYDVRRPLLPDVPPLAAEAFDSMSYGRLNWEFARADGDYERFAWFREVQATRPAAFVEKYRVYLRHRYTTSNLYWVAGGAR